MTTLAQIYSSPETKVRPHQSLRIQSVGFLPAASLNSPALFVHSGVCGSASSLSPEAVDIKRGRGVVYGNQVVLLIRGKI